MLSSAATVSSFAQFCILIMQKSIVFHEQPMWEVYSIGFLLGFSFGYWKQVPRHSGWKPSSCQVLYGVCCADVSERESSVSTYCFLRGCFEAGKLFYTAF